MTILLTIHSILRWVIMLVAAVAIVVFLVGWLRRSHLQGVDRGLMSGFSGLMDLEATIGLILLFWGGFGGMGFPAYRIEHGVTMLIAAGVTHMSARWRTAEEPVRYRNNMFLILASLVLVVIGISFLPGGLSR